MIYDFILEDNWTNKLTFLTVEGVDLDDCLDHVNKKDGRDAKILFFQRLGNIDGLNSLWAPYERLCTFNFGRTTTFTCDKSNIKCISWQRYREYHPCQPFTSRVWPN